MGDSQLKITRAVITWQMMKFGSITLAPDFHIQLDRQEIAENIDHSMRTTGWKWLKNDSQILILVLRSSIKFDSSSV